MARICLVEDNAWYLKFLTRFLTKAGHKVDSFCESRKALKHISKNGDEIDLVISDIMMPELDGITLLHAVALEHPLLKFIVVSGHRDQRVIDKLMSLGNCTFFSKGISNDLLIEKIEAALVRDLESNELADITYLVPQESSQCDIIEVTENRVTIRAHDEFPIGGMLRIKLKGQKGHQSKFLLVQHCARKADAYLVSGITVT